MFHIRHAMLYFATIDAPQNRRHLFAALDIYFAANFSLGELFQVRNGGTGMNYG